VLAGVFLCGNKLRARLHHRWWISIAGGVSVATIFMDLLPEISERQAHFATGAHGAAALFPEQAIYLAALLGFVLFYGMENLLEMSASPDGKRSATSEVFRIAAFAAYSSLIAYLLVHNVWNGIPSLIIYALAMTFHFFLVDYSLAEEPDGPYQRYGRWVLVLAIVAGWCAGMLFSVPEPWLARFAGFVSGGVIMNTLVVELPEGKGGRFWPFVLAAIAYTMVLILVLG
jgi:hypothetical protein